MQICTELMLFFGSEKLKCTNNFYHHHFPNYANFEGYSIWVSGTVCPVSGILKLIMADSRPGHFEFDQVENFQSIFLPETAHFVL